MAETRYKKVWMSEDTYKLELVQNECCVLKVKRVSDTAILPTRGSEKAAGIDLYADIHEPFVMILPGETKIFGSGIACEFPEGYWGMVVPRSSVGIKRHLKLANSVGVIDNDFRNEMMMAFTNVGDQPQMIERGERLAQMVLLPYYIYDIVEVDTLSETERGEGGIGSTGK